MAVAAAEASCERVEEDFEAKAKRAEEILACPNCKHVRGLVLLSPCGHSICEKCLKRYKKDQELGQASELHCPDPTCRAKVEVESENKEANEMKQLLECEKKHRKFQRQVEQAKKKRKQIKLKARREKQKVNMLEEEKKRLRKKNKDLTRKVQKDQEHQETLCYVNELLKANGEAAEQARRNLPRRFAQVLLGRLAPPLQQQQVPQQAQAPQPQQYQMPQVQMPPHQQAQVPWAAPAPAQVPAQPAPAMGVWLPLPYPQMQGCSGSGQSFNQYFGCTPPSSGQNGQNQCCCQRWPWGQ